MVGMLGHIGIGEEVTWGTPVAVTDYIEAFTEALVTDIERFDTRNIIGSFGEADDSAGVKRNQGDLVFAAHPANVGFFLKGAFGVNSVTSLGGGLFANQFTQTATLVGSLNPLPAYSMEVFRPGGVNISSAFQYSGGQVATIQMNLAPNQDLRVTATMIAKAQRFIAKTVPSFPTSPANVFTFDTASVSIGGAAVSKVEAFNFSFDNQLEGIPSLNNGVEIAKIRRNGPQLIRLGGTMEFEDLTDFDDFVAQTEQAVVVNLTRANSFGITIAVPKAVFIGYPVQIAGRERLTVDFAMRGNLLAGEAATVTLTTVNTF